MSNYCVHQKYTTICLSICSIQFAIWVHILDMLELPYTIERTVLSGNFPHARTSTSSHPYTPFLSKTWQLALLLRQSVVIKAGSYHFYHPLRRFHIQRDCRA